jgi:acyl-coenzyme A thioesterase PaaI-like protein
MNSATRTFIDLMKHPLKFRMFLLMKLPSAFFAGVRIRDIDEKHCVVTVPYKWFSQNPFKSTYFACLSMAAEMSTGAIAMAHLYKRKPAVSMLVVKVESDYFKKATGRTTFICEAGETMLNAIEETTATGEGKIVRAKSVGKNADGESIAEFYITWSFKAKR